MLVLAHVATLGVAMLNALRLHAKARYFCTKLQAFYAKLHYFQGKTTK